MLESTAKWVFVVRYKGALPDVERLADVTRIEYDCDLTLLASKLEQIMILSVRAQGKLHRHDPHSTLAKAGARVLVEAGYRSLARRTTVGYAHVVEPPLPLPMVLALRRLRRRRH